MDITYDYIISYLCDKQIKDVEEIEEIGEKNNFSKLVYKDLLKDYKYFYIKNDIKINSILGSLIYLLNIEDFYVDEKILNSCEKMIEKLALERYDDEKELLKELCLKLEINIFVLDEKIELYSGKNIIDLLNPCILLYKKSELYYPIFSSKKVYFYQTDDIIENLLDLDITINFNNYQYLDNYEQIIDNILKNNKKNIKKNISNNLFIKEDSINLIEQYKKMTKNILVEKILENDTSNTKTKLLKIKKADLINLLLKI